jgi:hypothetical protein
MAGVDVKAIRLAMLDRYPGGAAARGNLRPVALSVSP